MHGNIYVEASEGESLGSFDHVQTLMTRSMSTVSTSTSMQIQNNEKRAWISVGVKLSGVLYRWLDHWTRLPAIVLMPHALETRTITVSWMSRLCNDHSPSFESTRHQNDSWEFCPVVEPSVEHPRKLQTNTNPGSFFWTCTCRYSGH